MDKVTLSFGGKEYEFSGEDMKDNLLLLKFLFWVIPFNFVLGFAGTLSAWVFFLGYLSYNLLSVAYDYVLTLIKKGTK